MVETLNLGVGPRSGRATPANMALNATVGRGRPPAR